MVNKKAMLDRISHYFSVHPGDIEILPNGQVHVNGEISLLNRHYNEVSQLPVSFAQVTEGLDLQDNNLISLQGCPNQVGMSFDCSRNQLRSLEHGPQIVGWNYYCDHNQLVDLKGAPAHIQNNFNCIGNPLESLAGFPEKIGNAVWITYDEELPLLRSLVASFVFLEMGSSPDNDHVNNLNKVQKILNQYRRQGRMAIYDCQKDLIDAGFRRNARW